jgi:hypothetical protein
MQTGQTTIFRTGDDADRRAEGRDVDFFTLPSNNPFGNTNRFTDELGGQTYTNNIVIDWSTYNGTTVLGWRRTSNGVDINWNDAIDGALAVSVGTFTSGWRLPNVLELVNLMNFSNPTQRLGYSPILITDTYLWSSTTSIQNTSQAFRIDNPISLSNLIGISGKSASSTFRYVPVRTFTVTGTTLT